MLSKMRILGHPIHPMLVAFPVTSYVATLASLIVLAVTGDTFWFRVSLVANVAGVATALLAAIPGAVDYWTVVPERTVARRTGAAHAIANVAAMTLFAINLFLQYGEYTAGHGPMLEGGIALAASGVLLTVLGGFLGWEMVQTHHVGVKDQPDVRAVNDQEAVVARWIDDARPVTDSQVLGSEPDDGDRSARVRRFEEGDITSRWWPSHEKDSGSIPRQ